MIHQTWLAFYNTLALGITNEGQQFQSCIYLSLKHITVALAKRCRGDELHFDIAISSRTEELKAGAERLWEKVLPNSLHVTDYRASCALFN